MPRSFLILVGSFAVLLLMPTPASVPSAAAQQPADSVRAAALRDYHGPDLKGKDGPLAKAGLDLLLLYHEHQAARGSGPDTATSGRISGIRVSDGRVTIDAIAAGAASVLLADLEALGLKDGAAAGRVVSGRFPIAKIPALAQVESLRGVTPSRMDTHSPQGRAAPSPSTPSLAPETTATAPSPSAPVNSTKQASTAPTTQASPSPDSIRAAALRDYHGPDLEGKDGPLAKAGLDLLVLYHEHRAFQDTGTDTTFTPSTDIRLKNGRVGIEAVATNTAKDLLADLKNLGLKDGVTAGRLVSGWLPIEQIPAMARLESLRGLIQSTMQTRTPSSQPAPSRLSPPDPPSPPSPDTSGAQPEPGTGTSSDGEADGAGLFLLLLGGFLLAVES